MLEDILAAVAILVVLAFVVATIKYTIKFNKEQRERKEQAQRDADAYWESERIRRKERQQAKTLAAAASNTPPRARAPISPSYAPSPTQEVQSFNSRSVLDDIADIAIIASTVRHWNDTSPTVSSSERSVGWESSSNSSSSDSGPSFSDSGPSSDW